MTTTSDDLCGVIDLIARKLESSEVAEAAAHVDALSAMCTSLGASPLASQECEAIRARLEAARVLAQKIHSALEGELSRLTRASAATRRYGRELKQPDVGTR